jgi:hypothetical protein
VAVNGAEVAAAHALELLSSEERTR